MQNLQKNSLIEDWVDLYSDTIYSYALNKVEDVQTAEDLVQETFLAAIRSYDKFNSDSSIKTWLIAILKNKIADHFRKKMKSYGIADTNMEVELDIEQQFFDFKGKNLTWHSDKIPADWDIDLVSDMDTQLEWLKACIAKLPEKLKCIIQSKFIEEKSTPILCQELNISSSNFFVLTYRAKLILRNCIELKVKKSSEL